jgi:hypothetical protein
MTPTTSTASVTAVRMVRLTELYGLSGEPKHRDLYVNPAQVQFVHGDDWRGSQPCSVVGLGGESFFSVAEPPT